MIDMLRFYAPYAWRFAVLRRPQPLIYGIAVTDRCNLACRGCRVANTGRPDMTWNRLMEAMQGALNRGFRELYLVAEERAPIIDRLLALKRTRLPIVNSRAGLLALQSGSWPRRLSVAHVLDVAGEYVCCRAPDRVCADCGYAACTEIAESQRLRPSALLGMARYW